MIEEIREHVKKQCEKDRNIFGMRAYNHHFKSVVKNAKRMVQETGADMEIVEIAAWLHDIGSIIGDYENHHVSGAEYAEKLLTKYGYPKEKIEQVKHCIVAHRGSKSIPRETVEAECISDADAMSHFDTIDSLFSLAIEVHGKDTSEAREFVLGKLKQAWNKLTPKAKTIIRPKYEAAKLLLGDQIY